MLRHVTAALGILSAAAVFLVLHEDSITFTIDKAVSHDLDSIFDLLKEPNHLADLNSNVRSVHLHEQRTDEEGVEYRRFSVTESFPHIGVHSVSGRSVSDPRNHLITIHYSALGGILKSDLAFLLSTDDSVTEVNLFCSLTFPWILKSFVNRTSYEMYSLMFDHLEAIFSASEAPR